MSGRPKIKVFQYSDSASGHKYLRSYESIAEVFEKYYDGKVGKLLEENSPYKELPDGTYVCFERLGRLGLQKAIRRREDPTCNKRNDDKPIEIYNYFGEKVGEIVNVRVLLAITGASEDQIRGCLHRHNPSKGLNKGNLDYRYVKIKHENSWFKDNVLRLNEESPN